VDFQQKSGDASTSVQTALSLHPTTEVQSLEIYARPDSQTETQKILRKFLKSYDRKTVTVERYSIDARSSTLKPDADTSLEHAERLRDVILPARSTLQLLL